MNDKQSSPTLANVNLDFNIFFPKPATTIGVEMPQPIFEEVPNAK